MRQDLAVVDYRSFEVAVFLGNGDGTFGPPVAYPTGPSPATVAVTDFTGDGALDLAVPNWDFNTGNTVSVLVGNGNGTFQPAQTVFRRPWCARSGRRRLQWRWEAGPGLVQLCGQYRLGADQHERTFRGPPHGEQDGNGQRDGDVQPGRDQLRSHVHGELHQRDGGDPDGKCGGRVDVQRLEWRGLYGHRSVQRRR